ncbi:MAG: hypothetical protein ACE5K0_12365, partial [Candidatus Methanofastidiosia archaeon]
GLFVLQGTGITTCLHEFAHWWQQNSTEAAWYREGFPTAYPILALQKKGYSEGDEYYLRRLRSYRRAVSQIGDIPLSRLGYATDFTDPKVAMLYSKTTIFYTHLINYVGIEKMKEVNEIILTENKLMSEDIQRIIEEATGEDLDWLFSGWVFEGQYQDPWYFDWTVNLPNRVDSLKDKANELADELAEDELYIDSTLDKFDGLERLIDLGRLDEVKARLDEIEAELKFLEETSKSYNSIKASLSKNSEILDAYGESLNLEDRLASIRDNFERGKYDDFKKGIESLKSDIDTLISTVNDAQETIDKTKNFIDVSKPTFERLGLNIDFIEEELPLLEDALESGDFEKVKEISERMRNSLEKARSAAEKIEEAQKANKKRGFFSKDSSQEIAKARESFNAGNFEKSITYSENAIEINKQKDFSALGLILILVLAVLGAGYFTFKKMKTQAPIEREVGKEEKIKTPKARVKVSPSVVSKMMRIKAQVEGLEGAKRERKITDEVIKHFGGLPETQFYLEKIYGAFDVSKTQDYILRLYRDVLGE